MQLVIMKNLLVFFVCSCASATVATPPDAAVSTIPNQITGTYAVTGQLDLETLPDPATSVLAELADATDSPDDPARFLVEKMVNALPDGTWKAVAIGLADYVAPFVEAEIDKIAPRFATGVKVLAAGLGAIAHHVTTLERIAIATDGTTTRALVGLMLANTPVEFSSSGAPDSVAISRAAIDSTGTLTISSHSLALPYGEMLRLGLDRAVIPPIDLDAGDLSGALRDLVDCHQLGITFAAHAPVGSPALYETACNAGMTALADEIYDRFKAIDANTFELEVSGTAIGIDHDGDGAMDEIAKGTWVGATSYAGASGPLGLATFSGTKE